MSNVTQTHAVDTAFSLFYINENNTGWPTLDDWQDDIEAEMESFERELSHMQMVDGE